MTLAQRWFIALLPPQEMQDYANAVKQYFAETYASKKAFSSPPHVTIQPPFVWELSDRPRLEASLREFAAARSAFPVTLSGFAAFPPRVIFIDVQLSPDLLQLHDDLVAYLETALGIVDRREQSRPFRPHMTVAFRDLTKENFRRAWPEFQNRAIELAGQPQDPYCFQADRLTLLQHDGRRWTVAQVFPFGSEDPEEKP